MNQTDNNRTLVFFFFVIAIFAYQSVATVLSLMLYFVAVRLLKLEWRLLSGLGALSISIAGGLLLYHYPTLTIKQAVFMGFNVNFDFCKMVFKYGFEEGLYFLYSAGKYYLFGLPLFFVGLMSLIGLIPITAHESLLRGVSRASSDNRKEIKPSVIARKLGNLSEDSFNGTVLGVSVWSGQPVVLPDYFLNQMLLVLGTTGSGKTVTLRRFYQRALKKSYPLIIVDGKPTYEGVRWIKDKAREENRPFFGFNCDEFRHYDPLAHGGYTELKDKIMTLKDEWENDYYKSIAEDYLQTAFEVLLAQNEPYDLRQVVNCLDSDELIEMVRNNGSDELKRRVIRISQYDKKDITGLQAHLNVLLNSEMGEYFTVDKSTFSIHDVIACGGVAYFALPALDIQVSPRCWAS